MESPAEEARCGPRPVRGRNLEGAGGAQGFAGQRPETISINRVLRDCAAPRQRAFMDECPEPPADATRPSRIFGLASYPAATEISRKHAERRGKQLSS